MFLEVHIAGKIIAEMEILTFSLGQLQANCYLVIEDKQCLIIDPADSAEFILEEIARRSLQLIGLLATHGHFDHLMAVGEIQLSFPKLPLYIHPKDNFLVKRLNETAKYFLGQKTEVVLPQKCEPLAEGQLAIDNFKFQVIFTPGHTPGGCSYYFPKEAVVFTGDTLFSNSIGRYDFSYSSKGALIKSVEKILRLQETTTIYPGHGEVTLVQTEKVGDIRHFLEIV